MKIILIILLSFGLASEAHAKKIFKALKACPAMGEYGCKCKGWIIDHIVPLCAGGADHWNNMQ